MRLRYDPSGNRVSQGSRMFFLTRHNRSAPVAAACFHIWNPKKPRSARHSMPLLTGQYSLCQRDFAGGIGRHSTAEQDMSAVLHERHEADLRIRAPAPAGSGPAESFVIALLVGNIQRAPVHTHQAPRTIPGALRL